MKMIQARENIEKVVKWKWNAGCHCKYKNGFWEIFQWNNPEIPQPSRAEIESAIPEYQVVLNAKAEAEKQAEIDKIQAQATGNQKLLDLGLSQAEATALTGYTPPVAE
jgi:hypothetical protein